MASGSASAFKFLPFVPTLMSFSDGLWSERANQTNLSFAKLLWSRCLIQKHKQTRPARNRMSVTQSLSVHLPGKEKHLDQEVFQPLDPCPSLGPSFLISSVQGGDSRSQEVQLWEVVGRRHYFLFWSPYLGWRSWGSLGMASPPCSPSEVKTEKNHVCGQKWG